MTQKRHGGKEKKKKKNPKNTEIENSPGFLDSVDTTGERWIEHQQAQKASASVFVVLR